MQKNINLEAVSYVKIVLPKQETFLDEKKLENLKEKTLLQAQGEAVEFDEESNIAALIAVFDTVHDVSPEAVLKTNENGRVLVFEHRGKTVLRPDNIVADFSGEKIDIKNKKLAKIIEINIEKIWNGEDEEKDYFKRVKKSLDRIKKEIKPAEAAVLLGNSPAILFLIVEHLLYGITGEVWYQFNDKSEAIRIR